LKQVAQVSNATSWTLVAAGSGAQKVAQSVPSGVDTITILYPDWLTKVQTQMAAGDPPKLLLFVDLSEASSQIVDDLARLKAAGLNFKAFMANTEDGEVSELTF
jgi:hypothetical protein